MIKDFIKGVAYRLGMTATITVGHCNSMKGSSVLMIVGRKRVALTPDGARLLARQLNEWSDCTEKSWVPLKFMRWIIEYEASKNDDPGVAVASATRGTVEVEK